MFSVQLNCRNIWNKVFEIKNYLFYCFVAKHFLQVSYPKFWESIDRLRNAYYDANMHWGFPIDFWDIKIKKSYWIKKLLQWCASVPKFKQVSSFYIRYGFLIYCPIMYWSSYLIQIWPVSYQKRSQDPSKHLRWRASRK